MVRYIVILLFLLQSTESVGCPDVVREGPLTDSARLDDRGTWCAAVHDIEKGVIDELQSAAEEKRKALYAFLALPSTGIRQECERSLKKETSPYAKSMGAACLVMMYAQIQEAVPDWIKEAMPLWEPEPFMRAGECMDLFLVHRAIQVLANQKPVREEDIARLLVLGSLDGAQAESQAKALGYTFRHNTDAFLSGLLLLSDDKQCDIASSLTVCIEFKDVEGLDLEFVKDALLKRPEIGGSIKSFADCLESQPEEK